MSSKFQQNTICEDPANVHEIESLRRRLKNVENTNLFILIPSVICYLVIKSDWLKNEFNVNDFHHAMSVFAFT